jgi:polyhydroxybutyrate depolymerase
MISIFASPPRMIFHIQTRAIWMKQLFLVLLATLAISALPASAQSRHDITIEVESVPRQFIVVRPSGTAPAGGYPVVFMFHGTSGDGERFYTNSGWKEKGEEEKFITVFPSSLAYCVIDSGVEHRTTKWNNGELIANACAGQVFKDDILFVRRMIDTIARQFPIDRSRIYASGFSNGGAFTSKLAVEMSDVFAAVSVAAGALHPLDSAEPRRNIPIAYLVGSQDRNFLPFTGPEGIPFNDSAMIYINYIIRRYLGTFDLAPNYTKTETARTITWLYNTPASSAPATEFSFTLIKDMEHMFPNGTNYPLVAANALWPFFQRYTLTSRVADDAAADGEISIYPNPARSEVSVRGRGIRSVVVYDLLGRRVFDRQMNGEGIIPLSAIAPGIYMIEIRTEGGSVTRRLAVE